MLLRAGDTSHCAACCPCGVTSAPSLHPSLCPCACETGNGIYFSELRFSCSSLLLPALVPEAEPTQTARPSRAQGWDAGNRLQMGPSVAAASPGSSLWHGWEFPRAVVSFLFHTDSSTGAFRVCSWPARWVGGREFTIPSARAPSWQGCSSKGRSWSLVIPRRLCKPSMGQGGVPSMDL